MEVARPSRSRRTGRLLSSLLPALAAAASACALFPCDSTEAPAAGSDDSVAHIVESFERCGPPRDPGGPSLLPEMPTDPARREFFAIHPFAKLESGGGAVLARPKVVAVFFEGDPTRTEVEGFLGSYGCTRHWREAVGEYGVGDLAFRRSVVVPAPPSGAFSTRASIESWIGQGLSAGTFGPLEPDDILTVIAPVDTKVAPDWYARETGNRPFATPPPRTGVGTGMLGYDGLHGSVGRTPYLVAASEASPLTGLAVSRYVGLSRWLLAAVTNPSPRVSPAYGVVGRGRQRARTFSYAWSEGAALEIPGSSACPTTDPVDYPVEVATMYSNRRANAGLNPCPGDDVVHAAVALERRLGDMRFSLRVFHDSPTEVLLYASLGECPTRIDSWSRPSPTDNGPFPARNGLVTIDLAFARPSETTPPRCLIVRTESSDGRFLDETEIDTRP